MLTLWLRVDLGVMAMKEYSSFLKAPGLKPQHQMVKCHIQDIRLGRGDLTLQIRCSQFILLLKPMRLLMSLCHIQNIRARGVIVIVRGEIWPKRSEKNTNNNQDEVPVV